MFANLLQIKFPLFSWHLHIKDKKIHKIIRLPKELSELKIQTNLSSFFVILFRSFSILKTQKNLINS